MNMKSKKKICHQNNLHREVIADLLLGGGTLYPPPILGRVKSYYHLLEFKTKYYETGVQKGSFFVRVDAVIVLVEVRKAMTTGEIC